MKFVLKFKWIVPAERGTLDVNKFAEFPRIRKDAVAKRYFALNFPNVR